MKGDFSRIRSSTDPRWASVRLQQGRVLLDADWNEQVDVAEHLRRVGIGDIHGRTCAPWSATDRALYPTGPIALANFAVVPTNDGTAAHTNKDGLYAGTDLLIGAGRFYVDGLVCENETACTLTDQPDVIGGAAPGDGLHLVWLEVWTHHVSPAEHAELREVALGGPDTSTRTRVVWQVRTLALATPTAWDAAGMAAVHAAIAAWESPAGARGRQESPSGTLTALVAEEAAATSPCILPADAGYFGLQNHLYRVEISQADGGPRRPARFKWSRDNGSIVWPVSAITVGATLQETTITLAGEPPDERYGYAAGDMVELFDDRHVYGASKSSLYELISWEGATLVVKGEVTGIDVSLHAQARRWHPGAAGSDPDGIVIDTAAPIALEDGISVQFSSGHYEKGDWWTIPARSLTGAIDWPEEAGVPAALPPQGVERRHALLALAARSGNTWTLVQDLRDQLPPLAECVEMVRLSDKTPSSTAGAWDLSVRVEMPGIPVMGALVQYKGVATLAAAPSTRLAWPQTSPDEIWVLTGDNGVATVQWSGGRDLDVIRATMFSRAGEKTPYYAKFRWPPDAESAQAAGASITQIEVSDGTTFSPLALGGRVSILNRPKGLVFRLKASSAITTAALDTTNPGTLQDPVMFITVQAPRAAGKGTLGIGVDRVTLPGRAEIAAGALVLNISPETLAAIRAYMTAAKRDFILGELTVRCDFVKTKSAYVCGRPYVAKPLGQETVRTRGAPGGDFRLWFRMNVREGVALVVDEGVVLGGAPDVPGITGG